MKNIITIQYGLEREEKKEEKEKRKRESKSDHKGQRVN